VTLEESAPLKFAAVIEIKPSIALGRYVGLDVKHTPKPFTESEVDEGLAHLQEQHAEYRAVERAADVGDLVIVDYTLTLDGMEPRSETGYTFAIGNSGVMPEIEEAVIGLGPGGARSTRVKFPDDHRNEALRGKAGSADVKVTEVKEKVLPPLDDDFAKEVGGGPTLAELRAKVRRDLEAAGRVKSGQEEREQLVTGLVQRNPFELPKAMVERGLDSMLDGALRMMARQGLDPSRLNLDFAALREEMRPKAEAEVRGALLLQAVAEKEKIAVTPEEVDARIDQYATESGAPVHQVRKAFKEPEQRRALEQRIREEKTVEFLKAAAKDESITS
jgi:trigger factor